MWFSKILLIDLLENSYKVQRENSELKIISWGDWYSSVDNIFSMPEALGLISGTCRTTDVEVYFCIQHWGGRSRSSRFYLELCNQLEQYGFSTFLCSFPCCGDPFPPTIKLILLLLHNFASVINYNISLIWDPCEREGSSNTKESSSTGSERELKANLCYMRPCLNNL